MIDHPSGLQNTNNQYTFFEKAQFTEYPLPKELFVRTQNLILYS